MYWLQGTSDAIAWYEYRRSSLKLSHCTELWLNTRKAWEGPTTMGLSIVQDNGDEEVKHDESIVQSKSENGEEATSTSGGEKMKWKGR